MEERRHVLKELNTRAWAGESVLELAPKLDLTLKKNTAFIKKIRQLVNSENCVAVIADIKSLSLEKYLSEVIASLFEALCHVSRGDDISAATEVVSALHQRFSVQFTPALWELIQEGLSNDQEENIRVSRQKNLLRILGELYLVGVFRSVNDVDLLRAPREDQPIIVPIMKDILSFEIKLGNSLSVLVSFLKRFSKVVFDESAPFSVTLQVMIRKFTTAIMDILQEQDKKVKHLISMNKKALIRTGRIMDEYTSKLDESTALFEKLYTGAVFLSETVGIPLPQLLDEDNTDNTESLGVELVTARSLNEEIDGIWEDSREKSFYLTTTPISELLEKNQEDSIIDDEILMGEKMSKFLEELENASKEEDLEQLSMYFFKCGLNNKSSKARLLRFYIEALHYGRFKYYSKFLKINKTEAPFSELIPEFIEYIDSGFRSQIHHDKMSFKFIYFFVEMVKFKLIPTHILFHKFRRLTLQINETNNMDILLVLYEGVGRFLLYDSEYKELMREMINLLKDRQKSPALNVNQKFAISSMLTLVSPKKAPSVSRKVELLVEEKFIIRLFRTELKKKTCPLVLEILLPVLNAGQYSTLILKCFLLPEYLSYDNIPILAQLLGLVSKDHRWLLVKTIDNVIESIKRGLEVNDFRLNHLRMAHCRYIAEVYNAKLVNLSVVKNLMIKIICFGHQDNQPLPSGIESDSPQNYFRVQMVCLILNSMNTLLDFSESKKRKGRAHEQKKLRKNIEMMREFLVFFQYYMFCKQQPIPADVDFHVQSAFASLGELTGVERYSNLRAAVSGLQQVILSRKKSNTDEDDTREAADDDDVAGDNADVEAEADNDDEDDDNDGDDEDEDDDEDDEEEEDDSEGDDDDEDSFESNIKDSDSESDSDSMSDDVDSDLESERESEKIAAQLKLLEEKKLAEEFDRDFQRLITDSYEAQQNVKPTTNGTLGRTMLPKTTGSSNGELSFSLLTKKGKTMEMRPINVPSENIFATSILKEREDEKQHKEKIMDLIRNMEI